MKSNIEYIESCAHIILPELLKLQLSEKEIAKKSYFIAIQMWRERLKVAELIVGAIETKSANPDINGALLTKRVLDDYIADKK